MDGHALGEVVPSSLAMPLPLPLLLSSPVTVRSIASLMENVGGGRERSAECDLGGISTDSRRSFGVWFKGWGFGAGKTKRWRFFGGVLAGWLAPPRFHSELPCLFD